MSCFKILTTSSSSVMNFVGYDYQKERVRKLSTLDEDGEDDEDGGGLGTDTVSGDLD